jgi:hypothetical protein
MDELGFLARGSNEADHGSIGSFTHTTNASESATFAMGLQKGLDWLSGHLAAIGERIERLSERSFTVSALGSLTTFTGSTMLVGLWVVTEGTVPLCML